MSKTFSIGYYKFSNGHTQGDMSAEECTKYLEDNPGVKVSRCRIKFYDSKDAAKYVKRHGDGSGWKPHYNHGLGMWVETRRQYNNELKSRNLIEAGNEYVKPTDTRKSDSNYVNDDVINFIRNCGQSIEERDVNRINRELADE